MILTSLQSFKARGRAAETAARPPTRTKSSISVVTNRTFKKCPATALGFNYARMIPPFSTHRKRRAGFKQRGRQNCFPAGAAQFRVAPGPKLRRPPGVSDMTIAGNDEGNLTKIFGGPVSYTHLTLPTIYSV